MLDRLTEEKSQGGVSALVRFGIALAFTCLACVPARAQQSQLTPFSNWMAYIGGLAGYTVTQGDAVPFGQSGGCAAFVHVLGSCFGNNPATPYIIIQPPLGQATLPSWTQITPFEGPSPYGATVNDFYQVAMSDTNNLPMSDAIVTVNTLPPPGVVNPQTGMLPTSALTGASASDLLSPAIICDTTINACN